MKRNCLLEHHVSYCNSGRKAQKNTLQSNTIPFTWQLLKGVKIKQYISEGKYAEELKKYETI